MHAWARVDEGHLRQVPQAQEDGAAGVQAVRQVRAKADDSEEAA